MNRPAVTVERLEKALGTNQVLRGVSFEAQAGEIFGLLGPNGAGKTTTLRIICTLLSPDAGTVEVLGFGTRTSPEEVRRRIGVVTADIGVYPRLSARENIEYFARLCGLAGADLTKKVDGVIERLDMGSFSKQRAESLSSGQKQKVAIARAIVHDPDVLMLDEPTSNLDVLASKEVREFMVEAKDRGKSVIFSTHVMHDAERLCDRVTIIHQGRVVATGPTDEVRGDRRDLEDAFLALVETHEMHEALIVYRKELQEILRDRRTLMAIGLAALVTPLVLLVISQVSAKTATQVYTIGYSGDIPTGLDILLTSTSLKLKQVADPATAAKTQVDIGVAFLSGGQIDEYYDPSRQGAQIADVRFQTVLGQYGAAQAAAALQTKGIDPGILTPIHLTTHPLSSPIEAASNGFLSFFLPYILITMILTGGFSAALDSTAGERERRTLESLLLTPAPRSRVLLGKIGAITTISLVAAVAAIGSMFLALTQISIPGPGDSATHITLNAAAAPVMVWLALLIAVSFSALTLALGTLAKTFRQGQAYVTPLYFITILPASLILFIPDFNPSIAYYLIPILNAVLVLRDAIVHNTIAWPALAVTTASLLATGALSWYAALRLFTREALLTRS